MRTEIRARFRPEGVAVELEEAGLTVDRWWKDDARNFALVLATPSESR